MALDLTAGSLIRSGSGLLLLLLGLGVALLMRRGVAHPRLALGLALYGIGSGVAFIVVNLAGDDPVLAPAAIVANLMAWFVADAGLLLVLAWTRPRGPWRIGLAFAFFVAVVGWALVGLAIDPSTLTTLGTAWAAPANPYFALDQFAYQVGWALALLVVVALGLRHAEDPPARSGLALLAGGLVAYPAFIEGNSFFDGGLELIGQSVAGAALLAIAVVWLRATSIEPRPARIVAPIALGAWLLGMMGSAELLEVRDVVGYLRIAGVAVIGVALLKHDLLGAGLTTRSIRRGTVATGALAALFIVAQIAQNFLSDTYGLVMGGVVAGAFLFAAQPLQRAMERWQAPASAQAPVMTTRQGLAESERAYKVALRRFLADGDVTAEEEVALGHLADEAGLSIKRTIELRHEVERELGKRA